MRITLLQKLSLNKKNEGWIFLFEKFILFGILFFAFQVSYRSGLRGFFAFDQSIVFDGGYRVLSGQIPYKDFAIPFGPVVFWIQSIFFRLGGINYATYVFSAAIVNMITVGCSFYVLRILFPHSKWLAYIGGIFTSVWFYAPFGTPWPEQTAFIFGLLGLAFILSVSMNIHFFSGRDFFFLFLGGLFFFISFISKQNAGALFLPLGGIFVLAVHPKNFRHNIIGVFIFSLGWLAGAIAFGAWLFLKSSPDLFWQHFINIPLAEGSERIPSTLRDWISALFLGTQPETILKFLPVFPVSVLLFYIWGHTKNKQETKKKNWQASLLAISLFFYQNLFIVTSNNQLENSIPFTGIIATISIGLLWSSPRPSTKRIFQFFRMLLILALLGLMGYIFHYGIHVSFSRQVHNVFEGATFPEHPASEKLSSLWWAYSERGGPQIKVKEINRLVAFLEARDENFFIFPDYTILYGIVEVVSPQPLLWFHGGLTYPRPYDPALDARIVSDLEKNHVALIVIESGSWFGTYERLADFPQLEAYINNQFMLEQEIGEFLIYVKFE